MNRKKKSVSFTAQVKCCIFDLLWSHASAFSQCKVEGGITEVIFLTDGTDKAQFRFPAGCYLLRVLGLSYDDLI